MSTLAQSPCTPQLGQAAFHLAFAATHTTRVLAVDPIVVGRMLPPPLSVQAARLTLPPPPPIRPSLPPYLRPFPSSPVPCCPLPSFFTSSPLSCLPTQSVNTAPVEPLVFRLWFVTCLTRCTLVLYTLSPPRVPTLLPITRLQLHRALATSWE